jgi:hypothetical protein
VNKKRTVLEGTQPIRRTAKARVKLKGPGCDTFPAHMADKPQTIPEFISFDYIKGTQFRVVHADGAIVGATPGGLSISFFTERQPIPRRVVHKVGKDGSIGEEMVDQRVVRDAVVRDTDVCIVMTQDVARKVIEALEDVLKRYAEAVARQKQLSEHK